MTDRYTHGHWHPLPGVQLARLDVSGRRRYRSLLVFVGDTPSIVSFEASIVEASGVRAWSASYRLGDRILTLLNGHLFRWRMSNRAEIIASDRGR